MFLRYFLVLLILAALGATLAWFKMGQIQSQMAMFSEPPPAPTVSTAAVDSVSWQPTLMAVGSVQAVEGVEVSNQVAGQVEEIRFESGAEVEAGDVLVVLDSDVDRADLEGLEAAKRLAEIKLGRNRSLLEDRAVSQGDFDEASAQLDQARALVKAKQATIEKKTIRAPFSGRLGIRQVDLGQFLPEGSPIVPLQALDPVYADYSLPERHLDRVEVGQAVEVRVAAHPEKVFSGSIRAISPRIDRGTRNIRIRAELTNPDLALRPGMFARVSTLLPAQQDVLTLPREAIAFNTYGDSVFLISQQDGKTMVSRRQVKTGDVIDDRVVVLDGLAAGDRVVSAGQVKLRNDQEVQVVPPAESSPAESKSGP